MDITPGQSEICISELAPSTAMTAMMEKGYCKDTVSVQSHRKGSGKSGGVHLDLRATYNGESSAQSRQTAVTSQFAAMDKGVRNNKSGAVVYKKQTKAQEIIRKSPGRKLDVPATTNEKKNAEVPSPQPLVKRQTMIMRMMTRKFKKGHESEEDEDDEQDFDTGEASKTTHRVPDSLDLRR